MFPLATKKYESKGNIRLTQIIFNHFLLAFKDIDVKAD